MEFKKVVTFELHNADEFDDWAFQMENVLGMQDLGDVVDLTVEEDSLDEAKDRKVFQYLAVSCKGEALTRLRTAAGSTKSGRDGWLALRQAYASDRAENVMALNGKVLGRKWRDDDTVDTFAADVLKLYNQVKLTGSDEAVGEPLVRASVLQCLPDEFGPIVAQEMGKVKEPLEKLFEAMKIYADVKGIGVVKRHKSMALVTHEKEKPKSARNRNRKCWVCGEEGHIQRDCPYVRQAKTAVAAKGKKATFAATAESSTPCQGFLVDSCTDYHLCKDAGTFSKLDIFKDGERFGLDTAAGVATVYGKGNIEMKVRTADGSSLDLEITDVCWCPDSPANLLSSGLIVVGRNKEPALHTKPTGNIFVHGADSYLLLKDSGVIIPLQRYGIMPMLMPVSVYKPQQSFAYVTTGMASDDLKLLHARLGHLNFPDLLRAAKVYNIKVTSDDIAFCDSCARSKAKRAAIPKKAKERCTRPGELTHTDIMGPMEEASLDGYRFAAVFVDDATRFSEVYVIGKKSEVWGCFEEYINSMKQLGVKIGVGSTVQSDSDAVYKHGTFATGCNQHGIRQQQSPPYSQAKNGVVERLVCTLQDMARAMLDDAKLPKKFWGAALKHASYLRNRCPTVALDGRTPYQLIHHKLADISQLKKFGSRAFVHVPKDMRKKWDSKAREGTYVGEDVQSSCHLIFIPSTRRVVSTMHVEFDETCSGLVGKVQVDDPFAEDTDIVTEVHVAKGAVSDTDDVDVAESAVTVTDTDDVDVTDSSATSSASGHHTDDTGDQESVDGSAGDPLLSSRVVTRSMARRTASVSDGTAEECSGVHGAAHDSAVDADALSIRDPAGNIIGRLVSESGENELGAHEPADPVLLSMLSCTSKPLKHYVFAALGEISNDPRTLQEARRRPDAAQWEQSYRAEIDNLLSKDTWTPVKLRDVPHGSKIIGTRPVFKVKYKANGEYDKHKTRLVARGDQQQRGDDFSTVFAPVAHLQTVRTILALAVAKEYEVHHIDVSGAFLYAPIHTEVYIRLPEGVPDIDTDGDKLVGRLNKAMYGVGEASRAWNNTIDKKFREHGYVRGSADTCAYHKKYPGGQEALVTGHVDDFIIAAPPDIINDAKKPITANFKHTDFGPVQSCLGMHVQRQLTSINIDQQAYAEGVLSRFGMQDCKPMSTPMIPGLQLSKEPDEQQGDAYLDDAAVTEYRALVGCLMYLVVGTRPDLAYAVGKLGRYMSEPTEQHWVAAKHVLRYVKGTVDMGITYTKPTGCNRLAGFSDASHGNRLEDNGKSTSGYVFMLSGGAVSWSSKLQPVVALSTAEAEYIALAEATKEALFLRNLLEELHAPQGTVVIHEDNRSTIRMAENPMTTPRSKHIALRYHFIREHVGNGDITLRYIESGEMVADALTKALARPALAKHRSIMIGREPIPGEC